MSALDNIRSGLDSAGTRVFIGLVFVAFIAFFGGVGRNSGPSARIVASVNGEAIDVQAFQLALRQRASDQRMSKEDEEAFRNAVLDDLIARRALEQEARRIGIAVSDKDVARFLQAEDQFKGEDGKFDEKKYKKWLSQIGLSADQYEGELHSQLLLQRLMTFAKWSVVVTEPEVKSAWGLQETKLELAVVRMPTKSFLDRVPVSDADRDDYVAKHEAELKARYDASFEREFNLPKTYTLDVLLLRTDLPGMDAAAKDATRKKADELRAQLVGGAPFADLARRWSEDLTAAQGGALGSLAATQLDPVRIKAADAAGGGKVSEVYETGRGFEILNVREIKDAKVVSFDEAKKDLAKRVLQEEHVAATIREEGKKIAAAWTDPATPPRALLETMQLTVDNLDEISLDAETIPRVGSSTAMMTALQKAKAGQVLPEPYEAGDAWYVVAVRSRTEPDPATYDAGKQMVRATLEMQRARQFLDEWRQAVVAKAKIEHGG